MQDSVRYRDHAEAIARFVLAMIPRPLDFVSRPSQQEYGKQAANPDVAVTHRERAGLLRSVDLLLRARWPASADVFPASRDKTWNRYGRKLCLLRLQAGS